MIFVTVGTHEQQFDRLLKIIDELKYEDIIKDSVLMQTGYSNYLPKFCDYKAFLSYDEMKYYMENSKLIITHGGPSSYMEAVSLKKVPLVMPRSVDFGEHVNNHQIDFANKIQSLNYIKVVTNKLEMKDEILGYQENVNIDFNGNNDNFMNDFKSIINNLMKDNLK